jgi:hypothetical protein
MTTLHIEHAIVDFDIWKGAFDRFADQRATAGVVRHRIQQPLGDPRFVVIDLDFDEQEQAERFLAFLRNHVWPSKEAAPGLAGDPHALILEPASRQ